VTPRAPEISVVVPAYQEAASLGEALAAIARAAGEASPDFEILAVDDGSTDGTWAAIGRSRVAEPRIRGIRLSRNFGKEAAVFAGLNEARGRAVVVMDADLQHPPALLREFVAAWRSGAGDVIDGVKRDRQRESIGRRASSGMFNRTIAMLTGYAFEGQSDFKLLDRRVVDAILQMGEARTFFRGMVEWTGFRHHVIAYDVAPRLGGTSRWSLWSLLRLSGRAIISFSALPLRLIHLAGLAFLVLAAVLATRAIWRAWLGADTGGVTLPILLLLVLGACILVALGVVAEYIAAIYEEVKRRPRYFVAERLEDGPDQRGGPTHVPSP
jgi:glycosyltransferase involved in cell wall biosynthesis